MIDKSLWNEVTLDDFAESELRDVAERIGIEATLNLISSHGGAYIYIPTTPKGFARRYIRRHGGSHSALELTRLLGLSQSTIYRIIHEEDVFNPNQLSIFDQTHCEQE